MRGDGFSRAGPPEAKRFFRGGSPKAVIGHGRVHVHVVAVSVGTLWPHSVLSVAVSVGTLWPNSVLSMAVSVGKLSPNSVLSVAVFVGTPCAECGRVRCLIDGLIVS